MLDAKVPPIIIRLIINTYQKQTADVRWKGKYSQEFKLSNGVKQGAVLSPLLFCFYMNDIFKIMKESKNGCFIGNYYAGVFGYADDLLLLCPSRKGLQDMLTIAENYAKDHNISYSTNINPIKSKTKGIVFTNSQNKPDPVKVCLNGNPLPWIDSAKYLGNKITSSINGLHEDILIKRAKFIERNSELLQEFYFAHPELLCKLNKIYNSSFFGSVLWDLTSRNVNMIINSWSVSVRYMWGLPLQAHKNLIEPLGGIHAKNMIYTRFLKFVQSIKESERPAPYYLLEKIKNDANTITGKNLTHILGNEGKDVFNIDIRKFTKNIALCHPIENNSWKVNLIKELTNLKLNLLGVQFSDGDELNRNEIQEMINYVSTC